MKYDGLLDIAIGRSRKEINWRNKEMKWSDLVKKMTSTQRTHESYKEYMASKKQRQDEIKDVGGFVGGYLAGGRRKSGSVMHRQLITLDLDFATADFVADFELFYHNAAVIYSTHKHSPESPRYRLVMPLDREVDANEYEAIARRIAGTIDIELFDPTTFQAERLMYWPSTAADGAFESKVQDGPWISADELLATYHDWRDASEWPVSSKIDKLLARSMQKQGDPLEKPGVIGAFCRTYGIAEAIEKFLPDTYEATADPNRYTYVDGSTAGGLVVYDDKYAYSHHGTDPTSGKLCNAFDLVRVHKFGLRDEDAREGTPTLKLPSYTDMVDFAASDKQVRKQLGEEKLQSARDDFKDFDFTETESTTDEKDTEWLSKLEVDRKGNYYSTINNILLILENDPVFKGGIAFDEFEKRAVLRRNMPWRKITYQDRYMTDRDDDCIEHYLENVYGISSTQKLKKALGVMNETCKFHPIRDYLNGLEWDGEERIENILIEYLGAADDEFTRAVTRKALCAAVTRVYEPGAKFDYVLTFVGKEGTNKSSLIDKLGGNWYSDSLTTVQGKEAFEQLQGSWIIEIAELSAMRKAEVEAVKHFVSKRVDKFRVAYGDRVENFPRQCVFFGSTNRVDFLISADGNRRFWPVMIGVQEPTKNVFKHLTKDEINQIWAEAVELYNAGETLYLDQDLEAQARDKQQAHTEVDERAGMVQKYLDMLLPDDWDEKDLYSRRAYVKGDITEGVGTTRRDQVCIAEIWCEVMDGYQRDMTTFNTKALHNIMRNLSGWRQAEKRRFPVYGLQRAYVRIEAENEPENSKETTNKIYTKC